MFIKNFHILFCIATKYKSSTTKDGQLLNVLPYITEGRLRRGLCEVFSNLQQFVSTCTPTSEGLYQPCVSPDTGNNMTTKYSLQDYEIFQRQQHSIYMQSMYTVSHLKSMQSIKRYFDSFGAFKRKKIFIWIDGLYSYKNLDFLTLKVSIQLLDCRYLKTQRPLSVFLSI